MIAERSRRASDDPYGQPPPPAPLPERVLERQRRDKEKQAARARREEEKQERQREAANKRKDRYRGRGKQSGVADDLVQFAIIGALVLVVMVATLPALVIAGLVYGALYLWRPNRWRVLAVLLVVVGGGTALVLRFDPDAYMRHALAYAHATLYVIDHWERSRALILATDWLKTVWRTCGVVGVTLGASAYSVTAGRLSKRARGTDLALPDEALEESYAPPERKPLAPIGATELRAQDHTEASRVLVEQFCGSRRITCIASWPKQGKSFATMGLVRAAKRGGWWFGRAVHPFSMLWLTEESPGGFAEGAATFDLDTDVCRVEFAQRFLSPGWLGQDNFRDMCNYIYSAAKADGRDMVCWDSLTTFAPWALSSVTTAQFAFLILMEMSETYDMSTLVIAHNNKSGKGDDPVLDMLGSIGVAAMLSQVASFKRDRDTGICTLTVQGRRLGGKDGEWTQQARLDGQAYVPVEQGTKETRARRNETAPFVFDGIIHEVTPNRYPQLPPPQDTQDTSAPKRAPAAATPLPPKSDTLPRRLVGAVMALKAVPYGTAAYVTEITKKSKAQNYRDLNELVEKGYAARKSGPGGVEVFTLTAKGGAVL